MPGRLKRNPARCALLDAQGCALIGAAAAGTAETRLIVPFAGLGSVLAAPALRHDIGIV